MILYDRIMKMDSGFIDGTSYEQGFARGKSQAARIAKEADELMDEMAAVLESASVGAVVIDSAKDVLDKYDDWKENAK